MPKFWIAMLCILACGAQAAAPIVSDGDITLSYAELRYLLMNAPSSVKQQVTADAGARYEYVQQVLQSKRIAEQVFSGDPDSEEYFEALYTQINALRELHRDRTRRAIDVPSMSELAEEKYRAETEKYARVPEYREVSHILKLCNNPDCDEDAARADLVEILERLSANEMFEQIAREVSDDIASARNGGRLSGGIYQDSANIDAAFLEATFALAAVGDISPIIRSDFGFHIIRLEKIEESYLKPFDEVRPGIEQELRAEYIRLATQEALKAHLPSEEMTINGPLMDQLIEEIR